MSAIGVLLEIPIDQITIDVTNVRKTEIEKDLGGLAESMKRYGLLQPIVVQRSGEDFSLLIGQRRFLAARRLGWTKIAAIVVGTMDPLKSTIISLSENIQRRELPYRDMVEACDKLFEKFGRIDVIAQELGVSIPTVQTYLAHRIVPEPLKRMVEERQITRQDALRVTNATFPSILKGDTEKAVKIAQEIAVLPKAQKTRVLSVAETNPDTNVDIILEEAKKPERNVTIRLELPPSMRDSLQKAAEDMAMEIEDVIKSALSQWLKASGYS